MGEHVLCSEKLRRFTVVPAHRDERSDEVIRDDDVRTVVISPPAGDIAEAFALAKTALAKGGSVRLVGHGALFSRSWPDWVFTAKGLSISELGAYWSRPMAEAALPLFEPLRRSLEALFAGVIENGRGADVFYGQACNRLVQPHIYAYPAVAGMIEAHPTAAFICTSASWPGLEFLRALGASVEPKPPLEDPLDGARILATGALFLPLALAKVLRAYAGARASIRELRRLRAESDGSHRPPPKRWAAIYADWPRLSKNTLTSLGFGAAAGAAPGEETGLLLFQRLATGDRQEGTLRTSGRELWPTVSPLRKADPAIVIDQVAHPESVLAMGRSIVRGMSASARVIWRASRKPRIDLGVCSVSLGPRAVPFAKLATLDVLRAVAAEHAASAMARRWPLDGSVVVFPMANTPEVSAADVTLQVAGATTIELVHGSAEDAWVGGSETASTYWCMWTRADVQTMAALKRPVIVAGMPTSTPRKPEARPFDNTKPRILFLTNYFHRDGMEGFHEELHARELVEVAELLQAAPQSQSLSIHWRPHPREAFERVRESLQRMPQITISNSLKTPLSADLERADLVIASVSSSMIEALVAGLPVFVHVPARVCGNPATSSFDPSRQFFYARDGADKVLTYLRRQKSGEDVAGPERHILEALFGPTMWPPSLLSILTSGAPLDTAIASSSSLSVPEVGLP